MIVLQTPSFVALGADEQTTKKVSRFIVMYHTPKKGTVQVWLVGERQTNEGGEGVDPTYEEACTCMHTNYEEGYFAIDGLAKMHEEMLEKLETLNPSITFTVQI